MAQTYPPLNTSTAKIEVLARRAIDANARHSAVLDAWDDTGDAMPGPVEDAARAALDDWQGALAALAALPAVSLAGLRAKGAALASCITLCEGAPAGVDGDVGLAASLVADLVAMDA